MSSKADHYRGLAKECCLNAVLADDISRCTHWLEAAARWLSLGRQEGVLTTPNWHRLPSVTTQRSPLPDDLTVPRAIPTPV